MTSERGKGEARSITRRPCRVTFPAFSVIQQYQPQSHPRVPTYLLPLFQMIEVRWGFGVDYSSRHYIGWLLWIYTGERYYLNTFLCGPVDAKYLRYINAVCPHFSQIKWGSQGAAGGWGVKVMPHVCMLGSGVSIQCNMYQLSSLHHRL